MEKVVADDLEAQTKNEDHLEAAQIFKIAKHPLTLKFEDIVYKIKIKKGDSHRHKKKFEEKVILKGITGIVKPGEMLAMLGPSGSGKTTLLTALAGRLGRVDGSITYNGKPFSNAMKRNIGFVAQEDVLHPYLTVAETMVFTALLQLPNSLNEKEKVKLAEAVIAELGLTKCKNSTIGGPLMRGVSGGERKRVSIGQEILINPSLLFLDEPTSGLDSTIAQQIVSVLFKLANRGRTIVMTIHQPSGMLFYMFHKVLLLSEGFPLYFGDASRAMDYFASIGYCPSVTSMSPSDFLLDLASDMPSDESWEEKAMTNQTLFSSYKKNLTNKLKVELQENDNYSQDQSEDKQFRRFSTTWWQQFRVLLRREAKERMYESFSSLKIIEVLAVAFLSGLLWWQSEVSHLQNQIGLLFFFCDFWGFFPMLEAIFTFPQERMMLEKERFSGMYRLSAYFMSRILTDLLMKLVLPTLFVTITYWMARLSAGNFLRTLLSLLFSVLVSQGLGLAIGAVVMEQKSATMLGSIIMQLFVLTGGYYVQNVPSFIAWIKYVSIGHYTYKLLLAAQYNARESYPCDNSGGFCSIGEYEYPTIKEIGFDGQVFSLVALALMLVGYRFIAYIELLRIGVTRK